MKKLAIVICSYNRADRLEAAVAAADAQTARDEVDLVVVDDGSRPAVDEKMLARYGARLVRHPSNRGLGQARNTGVAATDAPLIAFTDDDCRPSPGWARAIIGTFSKGQWAGVGGPVTGSPADKVISRYYGQCPPVRPLESDLGRSNGLVYRGWLYLKGNIWPASPQGERAVFSLAGANMSFRREVLDAVGQFAASIRFGGEDEELCGRVRSRYGNSCLVVVPEAAVEHDYVLTLGDLSRRAFGYGAARARDAARREDWRAALFPMPLAVLTLALAGGRWRPAWALEAIMPLVLAPRWALLALRSRRLEPLVYAYLQLLQETATDVGYLFTYRRANYAVPVRPTGERRNEAEDNKLGARAGEKGLRWA